MRIGTSYWTTTVFFLGFIGLFWVNYLLHRLLAMYCSLATLDALLAKVLAMCQKKCFGATCHQIRDFGMELPSLCPAMQIRGW